ncbi:hypothetical protein [Mesorhizobium sp. A623]
MADRKDVLRAIKQHGDMLKQNPNVVGFGVNSEDGNAALAVYVSGDTATASGAEASSIPTEVTIDTKKGDGKVAVRVIDIGGKPELR